MQAYEISKNEQAQPVYAGDLKGVRDVVRTINKESRDWARVMLVDIPANKQSVVDLLNGGTPPKTTLRKWRLSLRGRLIEMSVTED